MNEQGPRISDWLTPEQRARIRQRVLAGDPSTTLEVDISDIDPEKEITIPLWRWHVLTCHSSRLRWLVEDATADEEEA